MKNEREIEIERERERERSSDDAACVFSLLSADVDQQ